MKTLERISSFHYPVVIDKSGERRGTVMQLLMF